MFHGIEFSAWCGCLLLFRSSVHQCSKLTGDTRKWTMDTKLGERICTQKSRNGKIRCRATKFWNAHAKSQALNWQKDELKWRTTSDRIRWVVTSMGFFRQLCQKKTPSWSWPPVMNIILSSVTKCETSTQVSSRAFQDPDVYCFPLLPAACEHPACIRMSPLATTAAFYFCNPMLWSFRPRIITISRLKLKTKNPS